jgi:hypothetical protein
MGKILIISAALLLSWDHNYNEDPGLCEDPDIYIEFDDGVFYQASLHGSEVAITADYPRPYSFSIVSIQRTFSERSPYLHLYPSY